MAKSDKFYFENFTMCTTLAKKAASYLVECLENYDPAQIQQMLEKMHSIEHRADTKKHEMREALAKAFVTPVDREDLDMLSHRLDDVTDQIEEILQKFYIYKIYEFSFPYILIKNLWKSFQFFKFSMYNNVKFIHSLKEMVFFYIWIKK